MKRVTLLVLTLVLAAALAAGACAEELTQVFTTSYYTLSVPGNWIVDTGSLWSDEDYEELGVLEAPTDVGLVIECAAFGDLDEDYEALWDGVSEDSLDACVVALMEDYEDDDPEYLGALWTDGVPIVVLSAEDDEGPYFCVDTVVNGRELSFLAYVANADSDRTLEPSEEDVALLKRIIGSIRLIG